MFEDSHSEWRQEGVGKCKGKSSKKKEQEMQRPRGRTKPSVLAAQKGSQGSEQ